MRPSVHDSFAFTESAVSLLFEVYEGVLPLSALLLRPMTLPEQAAAAIPSHSVR